jgi:hypothetical protein
LVFWKPSTASWRRAIHHGTHCPAPEELEELLNRAEHAAKESISMLDDALAFMAASEERIAQLEAKRRT